MEKEIITAVKAMREAAEDFLAAFGCGLYLGGNRRVPQNITIIMCDYD